MNRIHIRNAVGLAAVAEHVARAARNIADSTKSDATLCEVHHAAETGNRIAAHGTVKGLARWSLLARVLWTIATRVVGSPPTRVETFVTKVADIIP